MSESLKKAVGSGGIITHLKAVEILKAAGWHIQISPYYFDNISNSAKEIDIIAEKQINFPGVNPRHSSAQVNVQLFIECKYINQEIGLWFDELDKRKAWEALKSATGLEIVGEFAGSGDALEQDFHYLTNEQVVKLYTCSKDDIIYKAIIQAVMAQTYYEQWSPGALKEEFNGNSWNQIIRYPVVVCDKFENFYATEIDTDTKDISVSTLQQESFLLESNFVHPSKDKETITEKYTLVDFVDINALPTLLQNLEKEATPILSKLEDSGRAYERQVEDVFKGDPYSSL